MDTPRPTNDRVPLGDLTNTSHGDCDPNDRKRQRDRERYATMSDEKRRERNEKSRQRYKMNNQGYVEIGNQMAAHSTDGNTTNERDSNSDWLHMNTYINGLQQLSDGTVPLSSIGGTAYVDDINNEENDNTVHETGSGCALTPSNQLVTCSKERKRERDRARKAAMSSEQRAQLSKRHRELYAEKKTAKMLQMSRNETADSTDGLIPLTIGVPGDIDDNLTMMDIDTAHGTGATNATCSIDNIVTCPKERKRELDRARKAAMSPEQRALMNKRRRDLYAEKNAPKKAARKLQMTREERMFKRKESHKNYKRVVREYRTNNLHPESIAMESPHFNPQLIFPSSPHSPKVTSHDFEIPEFMGMSVCLTPTVMQNPEVESPELDVPQTIHRHRVNNGERNSLLSRRNRAFEANIGRRARGSADGKCNDASDPTQSSVVCNDGVTQEPPVSPPHNCPGTQTQPSVVDGSSSKPANYAQAHTQDYWIEDDDDGNVIFEDDEEDDEAYFFAGQEDEEEGTDVEHDVNAGDQDNTEPDVPDPYDSAYANIPSESHTLSPVLNCQHCNAKKFQDEPPRFCCRSEKFIFQLQRPHQSL